MNEKSLKELLIESPSKRSRIHASFFLHKNEILDCINEGWSVSSIWKTLSDAKRIEMSYPTFVSLVKRAKADVISETKPTTALKTTPGFTMDATPNKNKLF